MADICLIYNPQAGQGRAGDHWLTIQEFAGAHAAVDLRPTTGPGEAECMARHAGRAGYAVVVAAGGDGTVHEGWGWPRTRRRHWRES